MSSVFSLARHATLAAQSLVSVRKLQRNPIRSCLMELLLLTFYLVVISAITKATEIFCRFRKFA